MQLQTLWLIQTPNGTREPRATSNAGSPLRTEGKSLLTCGVQEHAYIDCGNAQPKYVEAFWKLANWEIVAKSMRDRIAGAAQEEARLYPSGREGEQ